MRSRVGAAWPFTFLLFFLLELLELVDRVDLLAVELFECVVPVCVVLVPEGLLWTGFFCWEEALCAPTAGTVSVPAVKAARSSPPRFLLQSS